MFLKRKLWQYNIQWVMTEGLPEEKQTEDCCLWEVNSYGLKSQQWYLYHWLSLGLSFWLDSHDIYSISILMPAFCFIVLVISNYFLQCSCNVFLPMILLSPFHFFHYCFICLSWLFLEAVLWNADLYQQMKVMLTFQIQYNLNSGINFFRNTMLCS